MRIEVLCWRWSLVLAAMTMAWAFATDSAAEQEQVRVLAAMRDRLYRANLYELAEEIMLTLRTDWKSTSAVTGLPYTVEVAVTRGVPYKPDEVVDPGETETAHKERFDDWCKKLLRIHPIAE